MVSVQRRLNSTGRLRITRDRINLVLEEPTDPNSFPWATATLRLDDLEMPGDASVSLEAYYRSSSMRFPCGTVGKLTVPKQMELTEIDRGGAIRFRLLIIAPDSSGKILASADGLRPTTVGDSQDRQPLLPLRETDLGSQLWKIDVDFRTGPTLVVNNRIPGLAARIRTTPLLQGLVLPHAFRAILQHLSAGGESEEDDYWGANWRKFLDSLGVPPEPEDPTDPDSRLEWVEEAVSQFCDLKDFAARVQIVPTIMEPGYA